MAKTKNLSPGVKSKTFACLWRSMFIIALGYPVKTLPKKEQVQKIRHLKEFYASLIKVLPCKFCRDFCRELQRDLPLQYTSRKALMFSIYRWKHEVNKKLIRQERAGPNMGWGKTKPSPPFCQIEKRYLRMVAKGCSKTVGRCV